MPTQKVRFLNPAGHEIVGLLDLPESDVRAFALFAHCFTCSKNLNAVTNIGKAMSREGFALLRFDFTGLGESEGEFAESHFANNISDLLAASAYLAQEHQAPRLLIGHSLGGAAVLATAGQIESVRAVATIGAPSDPAHVRHLLGGASFDADDRAQVSIGGRPFTISREFVDALEGADLLQLVGKLRRALMILHAPGDAVVGIDHAEKIFVAAKHPKSFVSLGDADHLLSASSDARFVGHLLAAWGERFALE